MAAFSVADNLTFDLVVEKWFSWEFVGDFYYFVGLLLIGFEVYV